MAHPAIHFHEHSAVLIQICWQYSGLSSQACFVLVQEEQKVAILRNKLEEMGIDVDSLLQEVGETEDGPDDA